MPLLIRKRSSGARIRAVCVAKRLDRGFADDQGVGEDRAPLDVEEVVGELPRRAELGAGVPTAKLRPAGETRLDQVTAGVVREAPLELGDDLRPLGARADDGHVAPEDVPELRQLVDVRAAQQATGPGDTGVVGLRPLRALRLGVDPHRPQLDDLERLAVLAEAALAIEDRAPDR